MKRLLIPLLIFISGFLLIGFSYMSTKEKSGDLDIEIITTSNIMPAAHNVYANEEALGGKYYLFKAKITNRTGDVLEDVKVRYRIPGYIDWTDLEQIGEMYSGQTASVLCYPKFNPNITDKTTESREKAEIEITYKGADEDDFIHKEFSFRMTNRNEFMFTNLAQEEISGWSDIYDNDVLLASFVTPNDPIVQYYTQNIQEKILKGESASVTKDPNEALRFLVGIYQATLQSGMVYSGTKGIPSTLQDYSQLSQHNRLPREVITGNTGLCLELSLLYASVLSNAGLEPIIFLVPGHAYPGFKLDGQFYAIEATGIGGQGLGSIASPEEALQTGMKQLSEFMQMAQNGDPRYTLVDVHVANSQGVTPMQLSDDPFLRTKVDDIASQWNSRNTTSNNLLANSSTTNVVNNTTPTNQTNQNNSRRPESSIATNNLSISVPQDWEIIRKPLSSLPILTAQITSDLQNEIVISVFDIPTSNANQALQIVQAQLYNHGNEMQYMQEGQEVSGVTMSSVGTLVWVGKLLNGPNGIRLVAVGTPDYKYDQNANLIHTLYNSIR